MEISTVTWSNAVNQLKREYKLEYKSAFAISLFYTQMWSHARGKKSATYVPSRTCKGDVLIPLFNTLLLQSLNSHAFFPPHRSSHPLIFIRRLFFLENAIHMSVYLYLRSFVGLGSSVPFRELVFLPFPIHKHAAPCGVMAAVELN